MQHHIISIGISKHQISTANLKFASDDAKNFYDLCTNNLGDLGYCRLLIDSEATLSQIRTALGNELIESVSEEDTLFFFFSGHGVVGHDPDEELSGVHYLVPFDATYDFESSCISVTYIREVFEKIKSRKILIFIDSCFSGAASKMTKGLSGIKKGVFKSVKTTNQVFEGKGFLTITACKEDEEAIEDPELGSGLFTYYLVEELQKKRDAVNFAVIDTYTPLCGSVTKRAKEKYNHLQNPTLGGQLEGNLFLPVFLKRTKLTPELISIPTDPEISSQVIPTPIIEIDNEHLKKTINEISDIIINDVNYPKDPRYFLKFEKLVNAQLEKIKIEWNNIVKDLGGSNSNIPEAISRLELAGYSLFITVGVISNFGNEKQMKLIGQICGTILNLGKRMGGLVAFLTIPEIIVVEIIYTTAIICVSRKRFILFKSLMDSKVSDLDYPKEPPRSFAENVGIHYCDALGNYASNVSDHINKFFNQNTNWLTEITPGIENNKENIVHQANLIIVLYSLHKGEYLWPNFARYYANRLATFIQLFNYDEDFRTQIITLFDSTESEIGVKLQGYMKILEGKGMGSYSWNSINSDDFI